MKMKLCTKCKTLKPREAFWKYSRTKEGLQGWCKDCMRVHNRESKRRYEQQFVRREINGKRVRILKEVAPQTDE